MIEGTFFWRDNWSSNPNEALSFYRGLFGWTVSPLPMGNGNFYNVVEVDGAGVGGVVGSDPSLALPARWIPYIGVDDVDATVAKALAHGGTVISAAADIPEIGRSATLEDPTGGQFVVMFVIPRDDVRLPKSGAIGTVAWNELITTDLEKAMTFYESVFGYSRELLPMDFTYYALNTTEGNVGGVMAAPPEMPFSAWTVYFEVPDLEASRAKAVELGGTNETDIMDAGGFGRFAIASDPSGAAFALFQSAANS